MATNAERTVSIYSEVVSVDNTTENVNKIYDKWAETYDKDLVGDFQYDSPHEVAKATAKVLGERKDAKIIDLGAGTGLVGEAVQKLGFCYLDALDANTEMLQRSTEKGIYTNIMCDFMGPNKLQIEDETYDAAMTCGTFLPNHANDSCFEEVIRILKPGGFFIFSIAEQYLKCSEFITFEPRIRQLEDAGLWKLTSKQIVTIGCSRTPDGKVETRSGWLFITRKEP